MLVTEINTSFTHDLMNVYVMFDKNLPRAADRVAEKAVYKLAELVRGRIKGRAGLTRWPAHPKGTRTTSEPGTPPARITSHLLDSVYIDDIHGAAGASRRTFFATVNVDAEYAWKQEEGFYNSQWNRDIPARPFMQPAYDWLMETDKADRVMDWAAQHIGEAWSNG